MAFIARVTPNYCPRPSSSNYETRDYVVFLLVLYAKCHHICIPFRELFGYWWPHTAEDLQRRCYLSEPEFHDPSKFKALKRLFRRDGSSLRKRGQAYISECTCCSGFLRMWHGVCEHSGFHSYDYLTVQLDVSAVHPLSNDSANSTAVNQ